MERLDMYGLPSGMQNYYGAYGKHFSKALCEWAVSKMQKDDPSGKKVKIQPISNDQVHALMKQYNLELKNDKGYDACYVANMCKADYLGSSIANEQLLCKFVKDYLDDPDGSDTKALSHFLADCIDKGIPIIWDDMM